MKWYTAAMFSLLTCLTFSACDSAKKSAETALLLEGKTMGTFWRVNLAGIDSTSALAIKQRIQQQLDLDDQELSTWKKDSALSRFNQCQGTDPQAISENMADIVTLSLRIGKKTHGAMDITIGSLVNLWGFGPHQQPNKTPSQVDIESVRALTGLQHLTVIQTGKGQWMQKNLPELYVDLSTVGEGFAADHLARLMEQQGINQYLVSVGGAVVARGQNGEGNPWRVAIQKPTDRENAIQAIVNLQGQGISTSGSYRNYYELDGKRISHVIDPKSGRPIDHQLVSATVIAPTALEADGWDTALMVLGTEKAKALAIQEKLAVYLITKQGEGFTSWMSPQFKTFIVQQ